MSSAPGRPASVPGDHYSYSVYADPIHAGRFDRLRFSGPIGTMLAEAQDHVLHDFLAGYAGRRVLDVGTGTGRAALTLAKRGVLVTGVDASEPMLEVARQRAAASGVAVTFLQGDAHELAFEAGAFDAVVCLRVLMHTPDWRRSLAELCRVARDRVVLDYPAMASVAAVQAVWRRAAARLGRRTEAYRVFRDRTVRAELRRHGFEVSAIHRQFVLPIALHKAVGSRALTEGIEGVLARVGALRAFGSPVTLAATRIERR